MITQAWLNDLGARDAVPGVRAGGAPGDLHNERDRGAEPPTAQGDQDQGALPERGRGTQAGLPRGHRTPFQQWTRTRNWTNALLAFKIHFGDRLPD